MPPLSDESRLLLRLLSDGAWHPLPDIMDKLAATVVPGKAIRRYDTNERHRTRRFGERKGPELPDDEKIKAGSRAIASDTFNSLKKRFVELRDTDDGVREIRRRDRVVPVADPRAHLLPGTPTAPDPPAGLTQDHIRAIVADEIGKALDTFQQGLQHWLAVRFADLEAARAQPPRSTPFPDSQSEYSVRGLRPNHDHRPRFY